MSPEIKMSILMSVSCLTMAYVPFDELKSYLSVTEFVSKLMKVVSLYKVSHLLFPSETN